MTKQVAFEMPVDTGLFSPTQLHPRAAFEIHMSAWAHWLRAHWVPFPRLIRERHLGVVILSLQLEHLHPFGFFDADALVATSSVTAQDDGGRLFLRTRLAPAGWGVDVLAMTAVLRPVQIADAEALAAAPISLSGRELALIPPERSFASGWRRSLGREVTRLQEQATLLGARTTTRTMHRHLCEAADQWSGIALPDLVVQGREELVEATPAVEGAQPLIDVLSRPLRHLAVEFHRPAFFLDRLRQETRAYGADGGFSFTHQFVNESDELLATCVEWLAHLPAAREGST